MLRDAKLEYQAALPSRFKRRRSRLGGSANSHFATPQQYRDIREYARDMARNDAVVKSLTWRAVNNIVRTGFLLDPQTGERALDEDLRERFREWADDKRLCDARGMHDFHSMSRMALYAQYIDGDVFPVLTDGGQLQVMEGDWVTSPMNLNGDTFHGVELDAVGKPLNYWFLKQRPSGRFSHATMAVGSREQVTVVPAYDEAGWPNVLHLFDPDRFSQNRGVCVFHPVFDRLGMLEDADFARLVQQQIVSCFAIFLEMEPSGQTGSREQNALEDGTNETVEDIEAGTITRLKPGEKPHAFSPSTPNPEYFPYVKMQLRIIGACIGIPLELILFDTTDTTFHGYRGALQQAYIGFLCQQRLLRVQFHEQVYRWKVAEWLPSLGRAALRNPRVMRHRWNGHGFPYVDPMKDAEADSHRLEHLLISPRRLAQERGHDWDDIVRETVEDRAQSIEEAMAAAKNLSAGDEAVTWREVLNLAPPPGIQVALGKPEPEPAPAPPAKPASFASLAADPRRVRRLARFVAAHPAALGALRSGDIPCGFTDADARMILEADHG